MEKMILIEKLTNPYLIGLIRDKKLGKHSKKRREDYVQMILESGEVGVEELENLLKKQEADNQKQKEEVKKRKEEDKKERTEGLSHFSVGDRVAWNKHPLYDDSHWYFGIIDRITKAYLWVKEVCAEEIEGTNTRSNHGSLDYSWQERPIWEKGFRTIKLKWHQPEKFNPEKKYINDHYEQ